MKNWPLSRRIISVYRGELTDTSKLFLKKEFIRGEYVDSFTKEFSKYIGVKYAIPTSSGRSALYAILSVLNLSKGSEIILPAYEDISVPLTIKELGLKPIFIDIDFQTQNIDLTEIKKKINNNTAAIIVAHLFGNPAKIIEIRKTAEEKGIVVIEDCAHAVGTRIDGKHVGTFGDISFFSFYTTKPFMCFGGGLIATNDEELSKKAKKFIDKLPFPKYPDIIKQITLGYLLHLFTSGFCFALFVFPLLRLFYALDIEPIKIYQKIFKKSENFKKYDVKFTNVQAFLGLKNLKIAYRDIEVRKFNASVLDKLLKKEIKRSTFLKGANYYFYIIFSEKKELVMNRLLNNGLDTGKNLMRDCPSLFNIDEDFLNTKTAIAQSIQIPIYSTLSYYEMVRIANAINAIWIGT